MRANVLTALVFVVVIAFATAQSATAHSGRTDSNGGHNCNVGSCAGTYHYHNGGSAATPPSQPKYVAPQGTITTKTVTEEVEIAFSSTTEKSPDMFIGETEVKRLGRNGVKTITYTVTYTDGVETSRVKTSESVTTNPVDAITLVGSKERGMEINQNDDVTSLSSNLDEPSAVEYILGISATGGVIYSAGQAIKRLMRQ